MSNTGRKTNGLFQDARARPPVKLKPIQYRDSAPPKVDPGPGQTEAGRLMQMVCTVACVFCASESTVADA